MPQSLYDLWVTVIEEAAGFGIQRCNRFQLLRAELEIEDVEILQIAISKAGAPKLRRLMVSAAYRVGYQDASHFNREYKSMFGVSPMRDVQRLRELVGAEVAS